VKYLLVVYRLAERLQTLFESHAGPRIVSG
jgi:hypothetical protein